MRGLKDYNHSVRDPGRKPEDSNAYDGEVGRRTVAQQRQESEDRGRKMGPKKPEVQVEPAVEVEPEPTSGTGPFYYADETRTYVGDWVLNEAGKRVREGRGTYADGSYVYDGEWKSDTMEGQGTFTYASGATYEGAWVAGKYHGQGTYKWADGSSYTGTWESNTMHGTGEYVDAEGRTWNGQYFNGSGPGLTFVM